MILRFGLVRFVELGSDGKAKSGQMGWNGMEWIGSLEYSHAGIHLDGIGTGYGMDGYGLCFTFVR